MKRFKLLQRKKQLERKAPLKRQGKINRVSKPRRKELAFYFNEARPSYLLIHKTCEVDGCNEKSTQIHHKKGKSGELLNNTEFFMAVCGTHHRYIEDHPSWAYQHNYSLKRNAHGN